MSKRYQLAYAHNENSGQTAHQRSLIRVFDWRSMGSPGSNVSSGGNLRLWSDWADAYTDLSLLVTQSHIAGFHVPLVRPASIDGWRYGRVSSANRSCRRRQLKQFIIWAKRTSWHMQRVPVGIYAHRRLRSVCASAQPAWSESSIGALWLANGSTFLQAEN